MLSRLLSFRIDRGARANSRRLGRRDLLLTGYSIVVYVSVAAGCTVPVLLLSIHIVVLTVEVFSSCLSGAD
jgi:hypothetical protein